MRRLLLTLWLVLAPCLVAATSGCEQEVRSVDRKQTVQESEPRMVSPGTEVLE